MILPATGISLPDSACPFSLSTSSFSDWRSRPGGGGATTSLRMDGQRIATISWSGSPQDSPSVDMVNADLLETWERACHDTAGAPPEPFASSGLGGQDLLVLALIAEFNTRRMWQSWSRPPQECLIILPETGQPTAGQVLVLRNCSPERASRWAREKGLEGALFWLADECRWERLPRTTGR